MASSSTAPVVAAPVGVPVSLSTGGAIPLPSDDLAALREGHAAGSLSHRELVALSAVDVAMKTMSLNYCKNDNLAAMRSRLPSSDADTRTWERTFVEMSLITGCRIDSFLVAAPIESIVACICAVPKFSPSLVLRRAHVLRLGLAPSLDEDGRDAWARAQRVLADITKRVEIVPAVPPPAKSTKRPLEATAAITPAIVADRYPELNAWLEQKKATAIAKGKPLSVSTTTNLRSALVSCVRYFDESPFETIRRSPDEVVGKLHAVLDRDYPHLKKHSQTEVVVNTLMTLSSSVLDDEDLEKEWRRAMHHTTAMANATRRATDLADDVGADGSDRITRDELLQRFDTFEVGSVAHAWFAFSLFHAPVHACELVALRVVGSHSERGDGDNSMQVTPDEISLEFPVNKNDRVGRAYASVVTDAEAIKHIRASLEVFPRSWYIAKPDGSKHTVPSLTKHLISRGCPRSTQAMRRNATDAVMTSEFKAKALTMLRAAHEFSLVAGPLQRLCETMHTSVLCVIDAYHRSDTKLTEPEKILLQTVVSHSRALNEQWLYSDQA